MIAIHNDHLVPPELCRLLHQAVPSKHHVPVRFFNRHDAYGEPTSRGHRRRRLTPVGVFARVRQPWIGIDLNRMYAFSFHLHRGLASSTAVWRTLVDVCLHEFGHAATRELTERPNRHEYRAVPLGRVYRYSEQLADDWKDQRVAQILRCDPRLGQPRRITGYLSVRLAEQRTRLRQLIFESSDVQITGSVRAAYVKEQRCWRTGTQLTCGDVLHELGLEPRLYKNAYRMLRRVSDGVGVDYIDGAGRRHKLYTWGDIPLLSERLALRGDELTRRSEDHEGAGEPPDIFSVAGFDHSLSEHDLDNMPF
jgi:hypothetical protein